MGKVALYWDTIKYMKPSQIYYRIIKKLGLNCTIGCIPNSNYDEVSLIKIPFDFDKDPIFLERFDADEFLNNKITFLHSSKHFSWDEKWEFEDQSALWNFNLHYFEYLFSMLSAYEKTGNKKYFDKTIFCIDSWIEQNPVGNGTGWSPYTIDLRLTNWISYYCMTENDLPTKFKEKLISSIHEQYLYLSKHIEKDILGNHYFEDLKTLILCSLFFQDNKMLQASIKAFKKECKEEILSDGMHFELSPMYHKIIFEGLIRVIIALRGNGIREPELEKLVQPMLDVAWSFEEGLDRIPLFNDAGNNVSKSLQAFVLVCKRYFDITPNFKSRFVDSGFYIFKHNDWKLIIDAGQPGPSYIPGHAHCDAMSFELFKAGKPVIVNCGTYAYQCNERSFFRSTAAHNTVMVNNTEQSQCWGTFRMAKRCKVQVINATDCQITIQMSDQKGQRVIRTIELSHEFKVIDLADGCKLTSFIHLMEPIQIYSNATEERVQQLYASDYGRVQKVDVRRLIKKNVIEFKFVLEKESDD